MSRLNFYRLICAAIVITLCVVAGSDQAFAQAQASSGQITGIVRDSNGGAIVNATVKAVNTQTALERSATTTEDGLYRFVLLPPGTYTVTAEASGFAKSVVTNVEVAVGQTTDANITVGVGGVEETITVTAEGVQSTAPQADSLINLAEISNLPINGRRFQDFVTLTPTAQVDPQRGQISLAGQRGINTNVNVDGVDYNQPFFGGIRGGERSNFAPTIPQEAIREFQVVASGYSPEFGRSTGGIVNAVTKSGTNDWHGSAFYLHRPRELVRNHDFFTQLEEFLGKEVNAAPTQQQWGGSINGPIKKDRMFFIFAYEQQRFRNPREVFFDNLVGFSPTTPTQEAFSFYKSLEETFVQTNDARVFFGKVDFNLGQNNRLSVRYNHSSYEGLNATSVGNALFPTVNSAVSNNGTEKDNTNTAVGQLDSTINTNLFNELRVQYTREERPRLANALQPTVSAFPGTFGTVSFLPTTQSDWRFQVFNNLTWVSGNHTLKFGAEVNHTFAEQAFGFNQFGAFSLSGTNVGTHLDILSYTPGVSTGIVDRFDSTDVSYLRQIGNLQASYDVDLFSLYAQDKWRIRPNFTLDLGLRWDGQFNPSPEANNDSIINRIRQFQATGGFPIGISVNPTQIPNAGDQLSPRVGFAWDPFNTSKTVIRANAGIYYATTPMLLFAGPMNNFRIPPGDVSIRLPLQIPAGNPNQSLNTVYKQLRLIGIDLNNFTLDKIPVITPDQVQSIAQQLGLSIDPFNNANVTLMGTDFENPKSYQWNAGVEHELFRGFSVSADFTYINTVHLQRNRDVNLPFPRIRANDPAQRPFFGLRTSIASGGQVRPISTLGQITVRESSARSLYRALAIRANLRRNWGQINASYTLGKNLSDDDNERDSGGNQAENIFDLRPEYNFSRLDRRHIVGVGSVFFLPYGFDLANTFRLRSGAPIDAGFGSDINEDLFSIDRPFSAAGVPFKRNSFRNRTTYQFDLRAQKGISFGEDRRLLFSVEFFNLFNFENISLSGSAVTNYCAAPVPLNCGFGAPTNVNFLSIIDNLPTSARNGKLLLNNNPGEPFQVQFGARFQF
jgi:Carboxypeptidase regulatory-like domain/TonB dependent receptor-like, beta-barrel